MLAESDTTGVDRSAFLALAERSGLIPERVFRRTVANAPGGGPDVVAEHFVTAGALTRFQAERLLSGKSDGFILGSYVILEPMSTSGGSRIYKARHKTMNRTVAIKVLSATFSNSVDLRRSFVRQTRVAAQLLHPNLITTYDANVAGERLYVVLEYHAGTDLETLLSAAPPPSVTVACELIRQAAAAVAHAHDRGLCHGGLQPSNLLVAQADEQTHVKVLNFGLAGLTRLANPSVTEKLDAALSAADYLAPELLTGGEPTPAGDVYALGCTLYRVMAGRLPTGPRRRTPTDGFRLDHVRKDLPQALVELVRNATAAAPERRPSAQEMDNALARIRDLLDTDNVGFRLPDERFEVPDVEGQPSGLSAAVEPSPFALLDDHPTLDTARQMTVTTVVDGQPSWATPALWAVAGVVILLTGAAIGLVVKTVVR